MTEDTNKTNSEKLMEENVAEDTAEPVIDDNGEQQAADDSEATPKGKEQEYLQLLQRVQADFDNFRRRTAQERADWSKYCSQRLATNLLPVIDNFERALQAGGDDLKTFREGIELIYRQLLGTLEKDGIKPMESVGQQFDPNFHEAVMQAPGGEYPDNTVIEEFQKGYILEDRVLRPAMVKVAKD